MAWVTLVNTTGNGMFLTVGALYFTQIVGLTAGQVGLGLTVAAVVGLAVSTPMGHVADVRGPRGVYLVLTASSASSPSDTSSSGRSPASWSSRRS